MVLWLLKLVSPSFYDLWLMKYGNFSTMSWKATLCFLAWKRRNNGFYCFSIRWDTDNSCGCVSLVLCYATVIHEHVHSYMFFIVKKAVYQILTGICVHSLPHNYKSSNGLFQMKFHLETIISALLGNAEVNISIVISFFSESFYRKTKRHHF